MVFNGVIGTAGQEACNGGPLVAVDGVSLDDESILGGRKRAVLDGGAKLIAPSEPARLAGTAWNTEANEGPISRAVLLHQPHQSGILLGTP